MHLYLDSGAGSDEADLRNAETLADDEWSAAWAEYRRECKTEEEEAAAKGITDEDVRNQTAPDAPQQPPPPLTSDSLSTIARVMSGIKLKPPAWAIGSLIATDKATRCARISDDARCSFVAFAMLLYVSVPEEVWLQQILSRAGYRAPSAASSSTTAALAGATAAASTSTTAASTVTAEEKAKAKKRKAKKKAKAAKAADAASTATNAATSQVDDFEPEFPPLEPAAAATN